MSAAEKRTPTVLPMRGLAPTCLELTEYDRKNFGLYTRLLIQAEDGATLDELAWGIFGFDPSRNREWARRVARSHLIRAQWIHDHIWPCID